MHSKYLISLLSLVPETIEDKDLPGGFVINADWGPSAEILGHTFLLYYEYQVVLLQGSVTIL